MRAYRVARRVLGTLHVLFVKLTKSGYHALLCYREGKLELWEVKHRTSPVIQLASGAVSFQVHRLPVAS